MNFQFFGVIEPSEHYGTNRDAYFWPLERHGTYIFPKIGIFPLYNPSQAKSADWKRRKTEAEEKPEDKVEESEEVEAIDDPMSWYFNWTIDQSADNLEIAKESIQQVPQHMAHILWLIRYGPYLKLVTSQFRLQHIICCICHQHRCDYFHHMRQKYNLLISEFSKSIDIITRDGYFGVFEREKLF